MANKLLLQRPIITEKATNQSVFNKYTFLVHDTMAAPEIRKVLKEVYKVTVTAVNIINVKPKQRRRGRSIGMKPGYKKAIVTLKKGDKIDLTTE
jgi:large subunit ribosomal protein L23